MNRNIVVMKFRDIISGLQKLDLSLHSNRQSVSPGFLQPRSYSPNKIATLKHVFQTVLSS